MGIPVHVFREYDIRGIFPEEIDGNFAYLLGRGYGSYISENEAVTIVVGQDVRLSSPLLAENLIQGLVDTGVKVIDIGKVPTPLLYFTVFHFNYSGGIMVTASHNPKNYNGFKLLKKKDPLFGKELQKIREKIEEKKFKKKEKGRITKKEVVSPYIEFIKSKIQIPTPIKVAIDPGNGTCGPIVKELFEQLNIIPIFINFTPDGNFPAHLPDPTVSEYMEDLIQLVKKTSPHLGIGYDGDGDRIGVIDEKGEILFGDKLLAIFSEEILHKFPHSSIVFEVKCSQALVEYIKNLNGTPVMWKTGHSHIKRKMKEINAPLGGEMSGHMFFRDNYYGYDDAIFASCRLIEILAKKGKNLSQLAENLPKYFSTPEIRVEVGERKKFKIVEEVKKQFSKSYPVITIDGVRVQLADGWFLIRASNTQPVIVVRVEATTEEKLGERKKMVLHLIEKLRQTI